MKKRSARVTRSKGAVRLAGGKPTLKAVSQASGFAVTTVSRALNDAPDISAETKRLIGQVAREIGYVPNPAGVRLRTGRTNTVSLALTAEREIMNHTAVLISAIAGELRETRFHVNVSPYFPDENPLDPVIRLVEAGSSDAIILNQTQPDDPRVRYLLEKGVPFATHGRTEMGIEHPYFDYDNVAFGRLAVRKLVRRGCRSIRMITAPRAQTFAGHMIAGARDEAKALGVVFDVEAEVDDTTPTSQVMDCVQRRLAEAPEIDAFIASAPILAIAVVSAAEAVGRTLGQNIQVATKEATPFLNLLRKDIIAFPEDASRAGSFLARAVLRALNEPDSPPLQELEVPTDDMR